MNHDDLRSHLARYGYHHPKSEETYSPDPIEIIDNSIGTAAAITAEAQADKLERRINLIRDAADLCARDGDWLALFETFFDEALNRG